MQPLPIKDPRWYANPGRACKDADLEDFYENSEGTTAASQRFALFVIGTYCQPCPVRTDCLNDALNHEGDVGARNRHGIQGGKTPEQRARYARLLNKPMTNCGTPTGAKSHRRRGELPCMDCAEAARLDNRLREIRNKVKPA